DLVLRPYTGGPDNRTPLESVDVVLHVTQADAPVSREIAGLREQTDAPIVLGLVGDREGLLGDREAFVDEALEAELSDLLLLPQPGNVIAFALRKAARGRASGQAKNSRVLMVSSTKGGTGKTSLAVNLAVSLAATHLRTLLIDLDVQFGDVGIILGLERPQQTLHDLANAAAADLDPEKLRGFVVRHESGLHVVPAPLRPEDGETIDGARPERSRPARLDARRAVDEEHPARAADARPARLPDRSDLARREPVRDGRRRLGARDLGDDRPQDPLRAAGGPGGADEHQLRRPGDHPEAEEPVRVGGERARRRSDGERGPGDGTPA